ncbi:MAG: glycosyltransferase family 2 protein [Candidatus Electrothrix sp. AX5]|nr:glycosyltransferase family 2 protein [Candidatus Electrothrix sp. AX5]
MTRVYIVIAVIIPYYKISFFDETLASLSRQTNKNFNVYIGNDNSKDDPAQLIESYNGRIKIFYKKFDKNIGETNLVKQWMRCYRLINNEEWFFFLPDDDTISENYIEEFYLALQYPEINKVNIIKYPCRNLSEDLLISPTRCKVESNLDFYCRVLYGEDGGTLGDVVFRRSAFERYGGFINFPRGWGSDHATLLSVSKDSLIYHVSNAHLNFRMSGENISSQSGDGAEKMQARCMFARWLKKNSDIFSEEPGSKFYKYFYWKGEYYFIYAWDWSLKTIISLCQLYIICNGLDDFFAPLRSIIKKMKYTTFFFVRSKKRTVE